MNNSAADKITYCRSYSISAALPELILARLDFHGCDKLYKDVSSQSIEYPAKL